jgi:Na+/proline symporter
MDIAVIISFIFFMTIFAGVGLASMRVKKDTTDDYLVAG